MLIDAKASVLLVIDMQERLVPAMQAPAQTITNTVKLLTAANLLDIPVMLTEQYPQGLGPTIPQITKAANGAAPYSKLHFSCMKDREFAAGFKALSKTQAIISGMEAHICVVQTAASLMDLGYEVFVVSDATASRSASSEQACISRLNASGAGIVTTEMVVFEWLEQAGTPAFKSMLPMIK